VGSFDPDLDIEGCVVTVVVVVAPSVADAVVEDTPV
jgi:hypothetical protein